MCLCVMLTNKFNFCTEYLHKTKKEKEDDIRIYQLTEEEAPEVSASFRPKFRDTVPCTLLGLSISLLHPCH